MLQHLPPVLFLVPRTVPPRARASLSLTHTPDVPLELGLGSTPDTLPMCYERRTPVRTDPISVNLNRVKLAGML